MGRRRAGTVAAGVFAVAVLVFFRWVTAPATAHDYRADARQAASGSLTAVRTVLLAGHAEQAGKVFAPYLTTTLDDATDSARTAQSNLAGQSPPDNASRALRDEVAPLLAAAVTGIGDVSVATGDNDDTALSAALDRLEALGNKIDTYLQDNQ